MRVPTYVIIYAHLTYAPKADANVFERIRELLVKQALKLGRHEHHSQFCEWRSYENQHKGYLVTSPPKASIRYFVQRSKYIGRMLLIDASIPFREQYAHEPIEHEEQN